MKTKICRGWIGAMMFALLLLSCTGSDIDTTDNGDDEDGDRTTDGDTSPDGDTEPSDGDRDPDGDGDSENHPDGDAENGRGEIHASPSVLDFGTVLLGDYTTRDLVLSNTGSGPLTVKDIAFSRETSREFSFENREDWSSPAVIPAGESAIVRIRMEPVDESEESGLLIVTSDAVNEPELEVPLIKSGCIQPFLELDPSAADFGDVPIGNAVLHSIVLKNTGLGTLTVTSLGFDNDATGAYSQHAPITLPLTIESGQGVPVTLSCLPVVGVHDPGDLLVGVFAVEWVDGDFQNRKSIADLLARATDVRPPCLDIEPAGDYRDDPAGVPMPVTSVSRPGLGTLLIKNCGDETLEISNLFWDESAGTSPRAFSESNGAFRDYSLARGQSVYLSIDYTPGGTPNQDVAVLQFDHNAQRFGWLASDWTPPDGVSALSDLPARVRLEGSPPPIGLEILPSSVAFGLIMQDCCSRPETIDFYAVDGETLTIQGMELGPHTPDTFFLTPPENLPVTIGGANHPQSVSASVRFCPSEPGDAYGTIRVRTDAASWDLVLPLQGTALDRAHQVDDFQQIALPKLDILFVVDCSGSMLDDHSTMAADLGAFINSSNPDSDLQLGLISMDMESNLHSGRLLGDPPILANRGDDALTPEQIVTAFSGRITTWDDCGSSEEMGLEAVRVALSEPRLSNENAGFLRDDAKLVVVFFSDEEDQSPSTVEYYIDFFTSIKGPRNISMLEIYAVVGDAPDGCTGASGEAEAGLRYIEVADACNVHEDQHFHSICSTDYEPIFDFMVPHLFSLRNQFFLSRLADPDTISVTVNDETVTQWIYDEWTNAILFVDGYIPPPSSHIRVVYDTICLH